MGVTGHPATVSDFEADDLALLDKWLSSPALARLSPQTRSGYRTKMKHFVDAHPGLLSATSDDIEMWLRSRGATDRLPRARLLSVLRSFYRWAVDEGLIAEDPVTRHLTTVEAEADDQVAQEFRRYQQRVGLSVRTITTRALILRRLRDFVAPRGLLEVTSADLKRYLASRALTPISREVQAAHLRAFYAWAQTNSYVGADPARDSRRSVLRFEALIDAPVIRRYVRDGERRGLRPQTLDKQRAGLTMLARHRHPESILTATREQFEEFLDSRHLCARTRYAWVSIVSVFYDWAVDEGLLERNPLYRLRRPRVPRTVPRPIAPDDFEFAMRVAPPDIKAMLGLGGWAGLRAGEIAGLRRQDILDNHRPPAVVVMDGKGGHQRVLPLNPDLLALLRPFLVGRGPEPLFTLTDGRPMKSQNVTMRVAAFFREHGIDATAHMLRHGFATWVYGISHDLRLTQALMGHASPVTTAAYADWDRKDGVAVVLALTRQEASGG